MFFPTTLLALSTLLLTLTPLPIAAVDASPDASKPTTTPPFGSTPVQPTSIPTLFPPPKVPDPISIEAIRNTLALYPLCIDSKNFGALSEVFAPDAVANYSAPLNVLTGLPTIESVLQASLAPVTTQHLYGTQVIQIVSPTVAQSVTYYQASHFGVGSKLGAVAYAYGQYQDSWKRLADGSWRISYRSLVYMGPIIGDLSVFTP